MAYPVLADAVSRSVPNIGRTAMSAEFEAHWRALPKDGLVPKRGMFLPEKAARFLRHLVLCDAHLGAKPEIVMRLIGSEFESRVYRNVKGEDYLQFLPKIYRQGAIDSVREIVGRPCGLWQVMPLQYARGIACNVEITIFPLKAENSGPCQLLILSQFQDVLATHLSIADKISSADTAVEFEYIDVGAGVPD